MSPEEQNDLDEQISSIVARIVVGEIEAVRDFFDLYSDKIYNFPIRFFNFQEDDAGDFFLYAFEHLRDGKRLSRFEQKSRFNTWFYAVLRNLVIDFLRLRSKSLKTTSLSKMDEQGNVIDLLDLIPDPKSKNESESGLFELFRESLESMRPKHRVLFKLAYIHYSEINPEDMEWLRETSGLSDNEIMTHLARLKEIGLKKANEVRAIEDKITANFQNILALEAKIQSYLAEHPELRAIQASRLDWHEEFSHPHLDSTITAMIQTLARKRKKHLNLLEQQKKSLLSVRVPYKNLVPLLGSSAGILSVQLLRIIEKLNKVLSNSAE